MIRAFALVFCVISATYASEYATFIGDGVPAQVSGIATDGSGNTYLAGTRTLSQSSEAFVMKLDPAGGAVFFRVISATGSNSVSGIAIDSAGNIYLGGATSSSDFPLHNALQATPGKGYLMKLDPGANQTIWSTYFREAITALAVDSASNVYVTGSTNDPQFPVTAGLPNGPVVSISNLTPVSGAFITKIAATGDSILYSGIISGNNKPCGCCSSCFVSARNTTGVSLAVDTAGNAYLAGNTDTSNIPTTTGAFLASGTGAFVAKVKSDGSGLVYLTYIGVTNYASSPATNPANTATAIACDANGNAYLTGSTFDPDFPATSGARQTTLGNPPATFLLPPADAFALKLNPAGTALVWASYLGGTGADAAHSIAVDASGQVWIAGTTSSPGFPNAQGWSQGGDFVTSFDTTGSKLIYSARYPNGAASRSVAVDDDGILHIAGPAGSVSTVAPGATPLPHIFGVTNAAWGPLDARIAGGEVISIYGPHIGPASPVIAVPDGSGNLPTSVDGYQVTGGQNFGALPLLYVSDSQINAVVPFGSSQSAALSVSTPSGNTPPFNVTIVPAIPEIFRNPDGTAVAVNQDGTLNSSSNPAPAGSYLSIWITGANPPIPYPGYAGQIATAANNYSCCAVTLGGPIAPVTYAGAAPGAALGVFQMNFQVVTGPLYGASPYLVNVT